MRGEIRHENGAELARNVPLIVWRLFPDSRESRRMISPARSFIGIGRRFPHDSRRIAESPNHRSASS
jgi:hypothetical protein